MDAIFVPEASEFQQIRQGAKGLYVTETGKFTTQGEAIVKLAGIIPDLKLPIVLQIHAILVR